jgi:hypothetical protein
MPSGAIGAFGGIPATVRGRPTARVDLVASWTRAIIPNHLRSLPNPAYGVTDGVAT